MRELIYFLLLEELWKRNADTRTLIIVIKLPGAALFIQLCCLPAGALAKAGTGGGARPAVKLHNGVKSCIYVWIIFRQI